MTYNPPMEPAEDEAVAFPAAAEISQPAKPMEERKPAPLKEEKPPFTPIQTEPEGGAGLAAGPEEAEQKPGKGRPKGVKKDLSQPDLFQLEDAQGEDHQNEEPASVAEEAPKRGRGRPRGSLGKPKDEAEAILLLPKRGRGRPKGSLRRSKNEYSDAEHSETEQPEREKPSRKGPEA